MNSPSDNSSREEYQETCELVASAFGLARSLGIKTLVVQADEISDMRLVKKLRNDERVIWIARDQKQIPVSDLFKDVVPVMPGHAQAARSIHNPEFLETLREYSALDGAFVIDRRGFVDSAGTYLNAPIGPAELSAGLGSRHAAALAITAVTVATAVVISSSSGTVSVYDGGETVLQLERAQPEQ